MSIKRFILSMAAIVISFRAFLRYYPSFGGLPSGKDRVKYRRRSRYFDGKRFRYPYREFAASELKDIRVSQKRTVPKNILPVSTPDFQPVLNGMHLTWFGHSSILIQTNGTNILIDPIFSARCFPLQWIGPRRFTHPTVQSEELPEIHVLLLTHDHHDHLDPQTIRMLDRKVKQYVVPLGVEKHLLRWGIAPQKIHSMSWWETYSLQGAAISCAPTRHFSGRRMTDRNQTAWCSYVIRTENKKIFVSGDGGFGPHFHEIHMRYGDMDLSVMECGQYNRRWHWGHLYPEESVQAAMILGSKYAIPVHWGAFVLSDHAWDDPPERFVRAAEERGLHVITPHLCETVSIDDNPRRQTRWWRDFV